MAAENEATAEAGTVQGPAGISRLRGQRERRWTEIRPTSGFLRRIDCRELWAYRDVALTLAARQVRVRYKQTVLGIGWVAVQPLVAVTIFAIIFGRLAGLPSEGLPYPVFALAGLVLWTYVSASVAVATQCLVHDRALITKVYFPRLLAPFASTLAPLIDLGVGLAVLGLLMAVYGVSAAPSLILMPAWIGGAMVIALAAGALCSALNVCYRDVGNALGFVLQFWLFVSPVLYSSTSVHGMDRVLLAVNPLTGLLDGARWSMLGTQPPPPVDLLSLVSAMVLLAVGLGYFQRVERRFADVV